MIGKNFSPCDKNAAARRQATNGRLNRRRGRSAKANLRYMIRQKKKNRYLEILSVERGREKKMKFSKKREEKRRRKKIKKKNLRWTLGLYQPIYSSLFCCVRRNYRRAQNVNYSVFLRPFLGLALARILHSHRTTTVRRDSPSSLFTRRSISPISTKVKKQLRQYTSVKPRASKNTPCRHPRPYRIYFLYAANEPTLSFTDQPIITIVPTTANYPTWIVWPWPVATFSSK